MTDLAMATCAVGGIKVMGCLGSLYAPDPARRAWQSFSRHEISGWLLTAFVIGWSSWLILNTPPFSLMPRIEPLVYIGAPLVFFLIVIFLDELLAPRALGGLLLLLASPVMFAARRHDSALSLIMTLIAYAWVLAGMVLVVSPYRFRRLAAYWTQDRARFRVGNLIGLIAGVLLLVLGIAVY